MGRFALGLRLAVLVGSFTLGCSNAESDPPPSPSETPTLSAAGVDARFGSSRVDVGSAGWSTVGPTVAPRMEADRIVYERSGGIVEWYATTERGIEQGFTISEPVRSDLMIRGVIHTEDEPRIVPGGLAFGGLTYSELFAWDATNEPLAANMSWDAASKTVTLSIPAEALENAVFPVTIDPLFSTQSWVTDPTDDADAQYGWSVTGAGDVNGDGFGDVVVSAPGWDQGATNEGRVYLFYGSASGLSTSPWTADPTDSANSGYGFAVAGVGDLNADGYDDFVVGARGMGTQATAEGRVYVYFGSSSGPTTPLTFEPTDQADAHFGAAVAGAGDVNADGYADLIVGAPDWDSPGNVNDGKVYLYRGSSSGIEAAPFWQNAPTAEDGARYGFAVGSAGDVNGDGRSDVVVGAPNWGPDDEGRAYEYTSDTDGPTGTAASWTADPTDQLAAGFGSSVTGTDSDGDGFSDIMVGAPAWDNSGTTTDEGRIYWFPGSSGGPSLAATWTWDPADQSDAFFGQSLAAVGDVNGDGFGDLAAGAPRWDGTVNEQGRTWLVPGSGYGPWNANPTTNASSFFGASVAGGVDVDGDGFGDLVIGAYQASGNVPTEGRAYVYRGYAGQFTGSFSTTGSSNLGRTTDWAGDVNGDGYGDLLVGEEGRAHLFYGSQGGIDVLVQWQEIIDNIGFGRVVAGIGDVDNDGYADFAVGALAESTQGRVRFYRGSPGGPIASATLYDGLSGSDFGKGLAGGDFNGDGHADLAVASGNRFSVFAGGPSGLSASPAFTSAVTLKYASWVYPLAGAGDLNGDGLDDLLVGVSDPFTNWSAVNYYLGRRDLLGLTSILISAPAAFADFGEAVAGAGDVNGDGFGDAVIGAPDDSTVGRAYVYYGTATGLPSAPSQTLTNVASVDFGAAAAGIGDVQGDGYDDVAVGDPESGSVLEGAVAVYFGSAAGISPTTSTGANGYSYSHYGNSIAGSGDGTGDGFADLAAGAWARNTSPFPFCCAEGSFYVHYGSDGFGLARGMAQYQADGATLIAAGGKPSGSSIVLEARATQEPHLGGMLALEFEVKRIGVPFDATGTIKSGPVGPGLKGQVIAGGLTAGASYHWRVRVLSPVGLVAGHWSPYGGNTEAEADFRIGAKSLGEQCSEAVECGSGYCADGVCCNDACGGGVDTDCRACSIAAGASSNGICGAVIDTAVVCRGAVDVCDVAETCDGISLSCPPNGYADAIVVCRDSADLCDVAETCTGTGPSCPVDAYAAPGTSCRTAADLCDAEETCTGISPSCPLDDKQPAGTICRGAAGICDQEETCDGVTDACPLDDKVPSGTVCRSSAGQCDVAESCDGATDACPADAMVLAGTICRIAADICDQSETCNGSSPACPADAKQISGTVCRTGAGVCDAEEVCDGTNDGCPVDGKQSPGTVCRSAVDLCDAEETCDGATDACPADSKKAPATVCRGAAGVCDTEETCDGATNACPADMKRTAGTVCRSAAGLCDAQETCDGATDACPADAMKSSGTPCRDAAGICDQQESCDGISPACPTDTKQTPGTVCRAAADICDAEESCDGATDACPADGFLSVATECRPGTCSGTEATAPTTCTGSSAACPASPAPSSCGAYACGPTACLTTCQSDADCATDHYCSAGSCTQKRSNGTACSTDIDCLSMHCVDGLCCDTACTGQCEACDVPSLEGLCSPVTGAPHGARPACLGTGACAGSCSGDPNACSYPSSTTVCSAGTCTNGVETAPATCDGAGSCGAPVQTPCSAYVCGATACLTSCGTDQDCAGGLVCVSGGCVLPEAGSDAGDAGDAAPIGNDAGGDLDAGNAVDGASAAGGSVGTGGASSSDGAVYSGGASNTGAAPSSDDAGQGPSTDAGHVSPKSKDDGGCGCRTTGSVSSNGAVVALAALAFLWCRRRRSGRSREQIGARSSLVIRGVM